MLRKFLFLLLLINGFIVSSAKSVEEIYSNDNKNQLFMNVEVALAEAQGELGIIPMSAAVEFKNKANIKYLSHDDVQKENARVRHGLVARLNVWKRSLDKDAVEFLHYGATTVDIMDLSLIHI